MKKREEDVLGWHNVLQRHKMNIKVSINRKPVSEATLEELEEAEEIITGRIIQLDAQGQSDEANRLLDAIKKLKKDTIPEEEVCRIAEKEGLKDAKELIQELKQAGEIYEPRRGFITVTLMQE